MRIASELDLPTFLVNTYDILDQNEYDLCSYNSAFHALGLAAARELANAVGDTAFASQCDAALTRTRVAMDKMQWNETGRYYNSYTNLSETEQAGAIMTDTFYSQVLAYSLGLGVLVQNQTRLQLHLQAEMIHNDSPLGMLVQTGRYPYPGPPQDNAVWQMGNPNWATLNIHLKQDITHALNVANKTLGWWRHVVNDLWNIPALAGGLGYGAEGQPWASSHYGYYMSSWHLVFALSGQQADLPRGTLTFAPAGQVDRPRGPLRFFPVGQGPGPAWRFPVLLPGVLGIVGREDGAAGRYWLQILFGDLLIKTRLAVLDAVHPGPYPLRLKPGDKVFWSK